MKNTSATKFNQVKIVDGTRNANSIGDEVTHQSCAKNNDLASLKTEWCTKKQMTTKNKDVTNRELELFGNLIASKKWLTTSEAAIYYGTTPAGIRNQVWRGQLVPYKRLGRLYFERDDLDRQIMSSRKKGE